MKRSLLSGILMVTAILFLIAEPVVRADVKGKIVGDPQWWCSSFVLQRGATLTVTVTVQNTGDRDYTFWVGLSFRSAYGKIYDVKPKSISLSSGLFGFGAKGPVTFSWTIPQDFPAATSGYDGSLEMTVALWLGYSGGYMQDELDRWGWEYIGTVQT